MRNKNNGNTAIGIAKGEIFFIRDIIPLQIMRYADIQGTSDGNLKMTFNQDVVAVVSRLHSSGRSAHGMPFVRPERTVTGARLKWIGELQDFPRLRAALIQQHAPSYPVVDSPQNAVRYDDEFVVTAGPALYFATREEIKSALESLPVLETGEIATLYVEQGDINEPDFDIRITDDPESATGILIRVEFDCGSRVVKRIYYEDDGEEIGQVAYTCPPQRAFIYRGRRLPRDIAA